MGMNIKKNHFTFALLFLISIILLFNFAMAVDLQTTNSEINKNLESAKKPIDSAKELASGSKKWDYLSQEWKKIFLSNPIVAKINYFLNKISLVFRIFIGVDYSFSLVFFFSLFLWFYLLYNINYVIKFIKLFKGFVGFAISLVIVMILGQVNFYPKAYSTVVFLIKIFYNFVSFIPYAIFLIICFFAVLTILFKSEIVFELIRKYFDKEYKTIQEQIAENDRALFHMIVNRLTNIFTKDKKKDFD